MHPHFLLRITWILLFAGSQLCGAGQSKRDKLVGPLERAQGSDCDTSEWKLVFHDEFDGQALDRSKWITYFPFSADGSDNCTACRYMGGTNSIFMEDQVSVADGLLRLGVEAKETTWLEVTKQHRSGTIRSIGQAAFTFGRFEIRCQLPEGDGLWPAFWMFGGETEIDVFEVCGEKSRWLKGSLHQWGKTRFSNTGKHKGEDAAAGFHVYAVEWEPEEVRWYVDGQLFHTRSRYVDDRGRPLQACGLSPGEYHRAPYFPRSEDKVSVIAGNGVSEPKGYCRGPSTPHPWSGSSSMRVDWIRVYQRDPQSGLIDLCAHARAIRTVPGRDSQGRPQAEVLIDGPHGTLAWQIGEGLLITARHEHGITVVSSGKEGSMRVVASCADDPCTPRCLSFEADVDLPR